MKKLTEFKERYLRKNDYSKIFDFRKIDKETYIIPIDGRKFLILREGKCDYKKCKNVCCKFFLINGNYKFAGCFFDKIKMGHILKKKCRFLRKNGKCKVWKTGLFPEACRQFPHPNDNHFKLIQDKCTIRFKIIGELK